MISWEENVQWVVSADEFECTIIPTSRFPKNCDERYTTHDGVQRGPNGGRLGRRYCRWDDGLKENSLVAFRYPRKPLDFFQEKIITIARDEQSLLILFLYSLVWLSKIFLESTRGHTTDSSQRCEERPKVSRHKQQRLRQGQRISNRILREDWQGQPR